MQNFGLLDFALVVGISQGIFLALAIQTIRDKNKKANQVLSILLVTASILLTGKFLYSFDKNNSFFFRIALFLDLLIFLFGPLLYMYFRRLIFDEKPAYIVPFFSFIPVGLMTVYYIWTLTHSHSEIVAMWFVGKLQTLFLLIETLGIGFNLYFCYHCYQLLKIYRKEAEDNLSYSQNLLPFLTVTVLVSAMFFMLWFVSYLFYYFLNIRSAIINYNTIWISFPVFMYAIGFYSLKQPHIFRIPLVKNEEYTKKERLEAEEIKVLKARLEQLMSIDKMHLNPKLTLMDLAKEMNTSTNNVSWLINNVYQCNFYDYVNQHRIQAFIEKVESGAYHKQTLLAMSLDSGFNSKSTFNKAFKTAMNDTPSNYIKTLKITG